MQVLLQLVTLVPVMGPLHCLLKTDCDQQADNDGCNMNEEITPAVRGVVGWMNVEHRFRYPFRQRNLSKRRICAGCVGRSRIGDVGRSVVLIRHGSLGGRWEYTAD